jgi:hypothetical protein
MAAISDILLDLLWIIMWYDNNYYGNITINLFINY